MGASTGKVWFYPAYVISERLIIKDVLLKVCFKVTDCGGGVSNSK